MSISKAERAHFSAPDALIFGAFCIHGAVSYLACLQCSDPLPEAVCHGFGDHRVEQRIASLLLFIQLFDDFLQLSIFLLLLEDHKTGQKGLQLQSHLPQSTVPPLILLIYISPRMTEVGIKGGISRAAELFTWTHLARRVVGTLLLFSFLCSRHIIENVYWEL